MPGGSIYLTIFTDMLQGGFHIVAVLSYCPSARTITLSWAEKVTGADFLGLV